MPKKLLIFGASGHGSVVLATATAAGFDVVGFVDDDASRSQHRNLPVKTLASWSADSATSRLPIFVAIGNGAIRQRLCQQLSGRLAEPIVHPRAFVDPSATLGRGTIVVAGAIVQAYASIGVGVIVNTGASVDHDGVVGDYAHVCPGVRLAGDVKVEAGVWIGIGAVVVQGVRLGAWAVIGAGSVVLRDVAPAVVVYGVPAVPRGKVAS